MSVVSAETIGGASKEWVMLRANETLNTQFVMVSDTTYADDGNISNKLRHCFWLPDLVLQKGEFLCLNTGKGKSEFVALPNNRMYDYYLNLGEPIWNDHGDRVTLFFLNSWKTNIVHGIRPRHAA